jgi:hypothetical protein
MYLRRLQRFYEFSAHFLSFRAMAADDEHKFTADLKALAFGHKVCYVDVFVHKALSPDAFVVGDKSDNVVLDLSSKPEFGKDVGPGRCFRLPRPIMKNGYLTLGDRFGPCPIKFFAVPPISKQALDKFQVKPVEPTSIQTLSDVCDVTVDTTVSLILKVVFVSTEKKGRYSKYKTIKVRDIKADKHFIQLFGDIRQEVQEEQVYKFNSLLVQRFRKEGEKWGRIRSQANTQIRPVSEEVSYLFSHVTVGDTYIGGVLIAHEQIHFYECCSVCQKKNFEPTQTVAKDPLCVFCGTPVQTPPAHDFSVNLIISTCEKNDLVTVLAFRRHLGYAFNALALSQIQADLEAKHFSRCCVEYDKEDSKGKSVILAQKVGFPSEQGRPESVSESVSTSVNSGANDSAHGQSMNSAGDSSRFSVPPTDSE